MEIPFGQELLSVGCECDHLESLQNADPPGPTPTGSDLISLGYVFGHFFRAPGDQMSSQVESLHCSSYFSLTAQSLHVG